MHPCLGSRVKRNRGRKTIRTHAIGISSALPDSKAKPRRVAATCTLQHTSHSSQTFVSRAAEGLQEPNAHCKRRDVACNNPAYHRRATAKHLSTMPPSCLSPIRSGPLAKDRNSLVCPTNICRYPGPKLHLHENWACGTIDPPIRNPLPCLCTRTLRYVEYRNPGSFCELIIFYYSSYSRPPASHHLTFR